MSSNTDYNSLIAAHGVRHIFCVVFVSVELTISFFARFFVHLQQAADLSCDDALLVDEQVLVLMFDVIAIFMIAKN